MVEWVCRVWSWSQIQCFFTPSLTEFGSTCLGQKSVNLYKASIKAIKFQALTLIKNFFFFCQISLLKNTFPFFWAIIMSIITTKSFRYLTFLERKKSKFVTCKIRKEYLRKGFWLEKHTTKWKEIKNDITVLI